MSLSCFYPTGASRNSENKLQSPGPRACVASTQPSLTNTSCWLPGLSSFHSLHASQTGHFASFLHIPVILSSQEVEVGACSFPPVKLSLQMCPSLLPQFFWGLCSNGSSSETQTTLSKTESPILLVYLSFPALIS